MMNKDANDISVNMGSKWSSHGNAVNHAPTFLPGTVRMYGRKSTRNDKSAASLASQKEACFEIAAEYGIPVTEDCWLEEEAGHGGDEWWAGRGGSGLAGDSTGIGRVRPRFSQLMREIVSHECTLVIFWSLDRMWRSAEIAASAIDIMKAQGCQIMDRNGLIDISSPEGRERVLINAVNAQSQREHSAVGSARGIRRAIAKGKLVGNCNSLGFRSAGTKTCEVLHKPDEHEVVRRIFKMYLYGDTPNEGPLSTSGIACRLMNEGYIWTPDLHSKRSVKRTERTRTMVYDQQIRNVLSDVRYIGKQEYGHQVYDCSEFLYEGETIVSLDIFTQVQEKLQQSRLSSPYSVNHYALSGRIRCGICAVAFIAQNTNSVSADPDQTKRNYWHIRSTRGGINCPHKLPHIRRDLLDDYIDDVLAPLLLAEIQERGLDNENSVIETKVAQLRRDLTEAERRLREELPKYYRVGISPELLATMERDAEREISRLRGELRDAAAKASDLRDVIPVLQDIKNVPESARRDAVRSVIRWVAVLPATEYVKTRWSESAPPADNLGSLVFLTCFGAYSTARLYRGKSPGGSKHGNCTLIREAVPSEMIGGVASFPDPQLFFDGLEYAWETKYFDWSAHEVTPGFVPGAHHEIVEFSIECAEPVGPALSDGGSKSNCSEENILERLIKHRDAA